jgi:hypothetical protein
MPVSYVSHWHKICRALHSNVADTRLLAFGAHENFLNGSRICVTLHRVVSRREVRVNNYESVTRWWRATFCAQILWRSPTARPRWGEFGLEQFDQGSFHKIAAVDDNWLRGMPVEPCRLTPSPSSLKYTHHFPGRRAEEDLGRDDVGSAFHADGAADGDGADHGLDGNRDASFAALAPHHLDVISFGRRHGQPKAFRFQMRGGLPMKTSAGR